MISVLAYPSSNPAEVDNFFCKIVVEKKENKPKKCQDCPILKL